MVAQVLEVKGAPDYRAVARDVFSPDHQVLRAEFTLQDPEYIAQHFTNRKTLYYVPHMQMYATDCDIRNTSRFLDR